MNDTRPYGAAVRHTHGIYKRSTETSGEVATEIILKIGLRPLFIYFDMLYPKRFLLKCQINLAIPKILRNFAANLNEA